MPTGVDQYYLDREVTAPGSAGHAVYVTCKGDTFRNEMIRQFEEAVGHKAKVVVIAIETHPEFCEKFQVMMVPTVLSFNRGKLRSTIGGGFIPIDDLRRLLDEMLTPAADTTGVTAAAKLVEIKRTIDAGGDIEDIKEMFE